MVTASLWPTVGVSPPKTMAEMLYDLAADLSSITNNKLDFYVDAVGVAPIGSPVTQIRYNCYIRVVSKAYLHLLFQVTTPAGSPFDATVETPEGDDYSPAKNKDELRAVVEQILQRPRTKEVIDYLLRIAVP